MSDTQWPTFQVFHQAKEGQAHQNAGSVHAPDSEMALLIARDVFVRRPGCTSLWVVAADHIFSKTAQELVDGSWLEEETGTSSKEGVEPGTQPEPYYVFGKLQHTGTHTYLGTIEARTPAQALRQALNTWTDQPHLVWWVFPARLVTQSAPDDTESMFEPVLDKRFRDQAEYHTVSLMRDIKQSTTHEEAPQ
ncbi:MAG: phenylacetic acid degradation protein [Anaerolineae bacterium]|jgi:ring-1,2-phenylacetyl-CoA epoxidase subunit PaaB